MENTQQQKVRHIPIFVEGRDQPVINTGHDGQASPNVAAPPLNTSNNNTSAFASAESSSGPHHQNHHNFGRPPMGFSNDMGFGQDMPGSIFDRVKDFPVNREFFMRSASPRRSESPINVHHQQPHPNQHQSRKSPSPAAPQQRQPTPQNQERPVQVQHETKRSSTPQRQPAAAQEPQYQEPAVAPTAEQALPAKQKAIEDSITKIQKIQKSVLDLMSRVEQFDGSNRREYNFLDEMLTQNLLKLDDIDAEGKENIKNARREAIKCINSLISLLEAKNDEAARARSAAGESNEATTEQEAPTQNGVNGASKNSSYDNVNNVKQTSSNNSVNMSDANKNQDISVEARLEAKVQQAIQQQDPK